MTNKGINDKKNYILGKDLRELNTVDVDGAATHFSRYTFWHYTKLSTVDKILDSGAFHVNNFANMNDLDEVDIHWNKRGDVFALCFSNSNTESIPMWYLYSGIDGKGAAIGFTPATMLKYLSSINEVNVIGGDFDGRKLKRGTDFEIQYGWVYYRNLSEPDRVLFKNKWYYILDNPKSFERNNFFIKKYAWEYEREFRIIFVSKCKDHFSKISVPISEDFFPYLKLMLAPEMSRRTVEKELEGHRNITKHLYNHIEKSQLSINMNLIERNKAALQEYFKV